MPLKKQFIEKGIQMMQIDEYLNEVLSNSGYAGSELQKTPLGLRITIKTARPGLVIGRKGIRIRELSDDLASKFGIDNPQIDVEPVENPDLNATIMAEALAFQIRKGLNYRRAAYSVMRRAIRGGARGVEVIISGKSTSQRARTQIFRSGIISKCGGPAIDGVDKGIAEIVMKSGTIGIRIKIMPLSYKMPDEIILKDP
ncbi:MAG: 30S ribosomal protein S3, partial [archaeon]|nr:30S ribosomal protein S3 [archaeon]